MSRERTVLIQTPEGIVFPLAVATPIVRFLALAIDVACVAAASSIVSTVFSLVGVLSLDVAVAGGMLGSAAIAIGYPMASEWLWRGQTLGKRLLRLQVMDEQGLRLQFSQVAIRNLLRAVDVLPGFYLVGGAAAVLSRHGQRLGDMAANTIVVRHPATVAPDFDQILPGKFNSLRAYPLLAARLRQRVSPREAGLALDALMRRDGFEAAARLALFAALRQHLEEKVRFPPEATDGLSDEQYVRNATDILFR